MPWLWSSSINVALVFAWTQNNSHKQFLKLFSQSLKHIFIHADVSRGADLAIGAVCMWLGGWLCGCVCPQIDLQCPWANLSQTWYHDTLGWGKGHYGNHDLICILIRSKVNECKITVIALYCRGLSAYPTQTLYLNTLGWWKGYYEFMVHFSRIVCVYDMNKLARISTLYWGSSHLVVYTAGYSVKK